MTFTLKTARMVGQAMIHAMNGNKSVVVFRSEDEVKHWWENTTSFGGEHSSTDRSIRYNRTGVITFVTTRHIVDKYRVSKSKVFIDDFVHDRHALTTKWIDLKREQENE